MPSNNKPITEKISDSLKNAKDMLTSSESSHEKKGRMDAKMEDAKHTVQEKFGKAKEKLGVKPSQ